MNAWVMATLFATFVTWYSIVQFKRTGDGWFIVLLLWGLGFVLLGILTRASRDQQFFDISWETLRDLYIGLGVILLLVYGYQLLWPNPFLTASQSSAKALEFYEQGDISRALRILRRIVTLYPQRADARYWLGRILNEQAKYREAVRHLKFARGLSPNSVGVLLELGVAFGNLRRYQDAAEAFEQALALEPENTYAAEKLEICRQELQTTGQ